MIGKILEAFFRHKLLILLPAILIPSIVAPAAVLTAPKYYESWGGLWVDQPTYLNAPEDWNRYVTPAQEQNGRITELLRTRTFMNDVARRTDLAPLLDTPKGQERAGAFIASGFVMKINGNHLLAVGFRAPTPELSLQVLNAIVDTYKATAIKDRTDQARVAATFYDDRLKTAQDQLAKSNEDLRRYVTANPRLLADSSNRSAADPELAALAELQRRVTLDQGNVERARAALDQVQLNTAASLEGQEQGIKVIDPPQLPDSITRQRRTRMVLFPAAALLVGVALSGMLLVLLTAADRSVRSQADLAADAPVLAAIPHLRLDRAQRRSGPDAVRRAIGFVAGAAFPGPHAAPQAAK